MRLQEVVDSRHKVFVDMDGVIADFDKLAKTLLGVDNTLARFDMDPKMKKELWKKVKEYEQTGGHMWRDLEPMPDAKLLWNFLEQLHRDGLTEYPQILSATGQPHFGAEQQKREWIRKHFGSHIKVNLTETAAQKSQFACSSCILIDDRPKAIDPWTAAGGIGILHTSAKNTIEQLKKILQQ